MADGISFDIVKTAFDGVMAEIGENTERATMYALRETGRKIGERARAVAPVYPGPRNQSAYTDARAQAEAGALKRSIHNSKNIKNDGGTYSMAVGPFGAVTRKGGGARGVQLYRGQAEALYGYMAAGFTGADIAAEYQKALAVAWGKFR